MTPAHPRASLLFSLLGALALSLPALGQGTNPPPAAAVPKAVVLEPSWDFGRAANTNAVAHEFELSNAGGADLVVQQVSAGCGCTAASAGSNRVAPGGRTAIKVRLDLAGRTGPQRKSVYVHVNDPERPVVRLEVSGEATGTAGGPSDAATVVVRDGRPRVEPDRIDFGRVRADATSEGEVVLRGASSNDVVKVEGIETGATSLSAKVEPGRPGECRVALRLSPGTELGHGKATVTIRTSHPVLKAVTVPVTWKAEGDLRAMPEEVTVMARPGATNAVVRHVAVRSASGRPVRLSGVSCEGPGVSAEPEDAPGGGAMVRVSVAGAPADGPARLLVVREAGGARLTIPILAAAPPAKPRAGVLSGIVSPATAASCCPSRSSRR